MSLSACPWCTWTRTSGATFLAQFLKRLRPCSCPLSSVPTPSPASPPSPKALKLQKSVTAVSALHDASVDEPAPFILPPGEYPDVDREVMMKLTIDVEWGMLDIFDEEAKAQASDFSNCWFRCQGGDPKTAGSLCEGIDDATTCKGGGVCSYKVDVV